MTIRPIDIARKLGISTTSLRKYEELGLLPPVSRSEAGYRIFTPQHIAYFVCIREMTVGFSLNRVSKMLKEVQAKKIDAALWLANQAQADLHQEKNIAHKIELNLFQSNPPPSGSEAQSMTIHQVSRETGVPATTIRYWERVGLLSVERARENNYRLFTAAHIRQILTIYALKLSIYSNSHQHSIERVKEALKEFDPNDTDRLAAIISDLEQYLNRTNRGQLRGIAALYRLCTQVETNHFE